MSLLGNGRLRKLKIFFARVVFGSFLNDFFVHQNSERQKWLHLMLLMSLYLVTISTDFLQSFPKYVLRTKEPLPKTACANNNCSKAGIKHALLTVSGVKLTAAIVMPGTLKMSFIRKK